MLGESHTKSLLTPYLLSINQILCLKSMLIYLMQILSWLSFKMFTFLSRFICSNGFPSTRTKCKEASHQSNVLSNSNVKACITFMAFVSLNQPHSLISWNIISARNKHRLGSNLNRTVKPFITIWFRLELP